MDVSTTMSNWCLLRVDAYLCFIATAHKLVTSSYESPKPFWHWSCSISSLTSRMPQNRHYSTQNVSEYDCYLSSFMHHEWDILYLHHVCGWSLTDHKFWVSDAPQHSSWTNLQWHDTGICSIFKPVCNTIKFWQFLNNLSCKWLTWTLRFPPMTRALEATCISIHLSSSYVLLAILDFD